MFVNVTIVDVVRHRTYPGWFLIRNGRFCLVEEASSTPPPCEEKVDLQGQTVIPGLVDMHMHIESSLTTPRRFAETVLPHGTVTVLADPHETANVLGARGIELILDLSQDLPLTVYVSLPSCVPASSPELETSATEITEEHLETLAEHPRVKALGEVMNYRGVLRGDARVTGIMRMARRRGLLIEGHIPTLSGIELSRYLSYSVKTDHTLTNPDKILEQLSKGVCVQLQEKSLTRENVETLSNLDDLSRVTFVTDDTVGSQIIKGHLLSNVKRAISLGMDPYQALACATYRPASILGLRNAGVLAPGFDADFVVVDSFPSMTVKSVYKSGEMVARDGACLNAETDRGGPPSWSLCTVNLATLVPDDFRLPVSDGIHTANVIEANAINTLTSLGTLKMFMHGGLAELPEDTVLAAVFERHGRRGGRGFAFVRGYGLQRGACASTMAHDAHNLLVLGRDVQSMVSAANAVIRSQGGIAVAEGEGLLAHLPLPVAGIMTDRSVHETVQGIESIEVHLRRLGVTHKDPLVFLTMLTLTTSPGHKVTDRGLIDVERTCLLPLFCD
ncbi:MAG: adenine deaminase C-terminal domain-containing protein [Bacillota bacterium]